MRPLGCHPDGALQKSLDARRGFRYNRFTMQIQQILKEKHAQILSIALSHGAARVRLFGSVARGEQTDASDLDLLVKMRPGATLLDIVAIKQDLEDLLGIGVDVVTEDSLSPYLREDILKEAVNL